MSHDYFEASFFFIVSKKKKKEIIKCLEISALKKNLEKKEQLISR